MTLIDVIAIAARQWRHANRSWVAAATAAGALSGPAVMFGRRGNVAIEVDA